MLSPDGDEILEEIDPSKVYCIGGIVDRTTKKNLSKGWAVRLGMILFYRYGLHI
jgi:Trm5-related predicted tRNA methylase